MRQVQEPVFIQALVTQPSVERLDVGILVRFAWFNQAQCYVVHMRPGQHGASAELLAVVGTDHLWQTAGDGQPIEDSRGGRSDFLSHFLSSSSRPVVVQFESGSFPVESGSFPAPAKQSKQAAQSGLQVFCA